MRSVNAGLARYLRENPSRAGREDLALVNAFVDVDADRPPAERQQEQQADLTGYETYVAFLTRVSPRRWRPTASE